MAADEHAKTLILDSAVDQLLKSPKFTTAVLAQNLAGAANAAASVLLQQGDPPASRLKHAVSGASSTSRAALDAFRTGDRVVVQLSSGHGHAQEALVSCRTNATGLLNLQLLGPAVTCGAQAPAEPAQGTEKPARPLSARLPSATVPSELLTPKMPGLYAANGTQGYTPALGRGPRGTGGGTFLALPDALDTLRSQLMEMEEKVPWTAVRRSWRLQRSAWRRGVRSTTALTDMAIRIRELLQALATDDTPFPGCGTAWRTTLNSVCLGQHQQPALLITLCEEFRSSLEHWLAAREAAPHGDSPSQLNTNAVRAVQALQKAAVLGPEALQQVPLEAIVGHDRNGLLLVRQTLEAQRQAAIAQMDTAASGTDVNVLPATFFQQAVHGTVADGTDQWARVAEEALRADYDSGSDTEEEVNSEVTNMSESE